ncbi:MAG: hypothetical protein PUG48_05635 [Clostridia bacterium]|nr:hypothetical protein [Clostridia bacterium]
MNPKYNAEIGYYRNQAQHAKHNGDRETYAKYKGLAEGYIKALHHTGIISDFEMDDKMRYIDV